jgi:RNA polymerase sigma factor (sigma-70 family)
MNLRFKRESDGQNLFPHLLNGSGTALARLFVALVETHQQADGSIRVPEPLRPYLENIYELDHLQQKLESLTRREMQILREIAKGLSNKQVASVLHISEGTVKVHVKSLLKKLEAQSRVEAAVMYLEQRN